MKIGIVTYYQAINNGAFLQAYCLKNALEAIYGENVGFIKYSTSGILTGLLKTTKNPKRLINIFMRYMSIRKAQKKYFKESGRSEKYNYVVVGSDELWNVKNPVFTEENFGKGLIAEKLVSYAVSMGNTSLSDKLPENFSEEISRFSKISVRDENSAGIIEKKYGVKPELNLDPVFLSDIPFEKPKIKNKYLMVYGGIERKELTEMIMAYAKEKGLEVISVDSYNSWCKTVVSKNPFEFVGYIYEAECVVTNMFHGTMLSICMEKDFMTILTPARQKKMTYAIKLFNVEDRAVSEQSLINNPRQMDDVFSLKLNHSKIKETIETERRKAVQYLTL